MILALPHMGNWDHAGAWATTFVPQFTTVAERLKPEKLFERWLRYRESIGMEVLPLTGGSGTFGGLMRRLRAGGLVCLVAERDLTDSGVPVEFFGETTKLPAGPAALAIATGAALHPVTLWYGEDAGDAKVWPGTSRCRPEALAASGQKVGGDDPGDGRHLRRGHRRAPGRLAHAPAALARRPRPAAPGRRERGRRTERPDGGGRRPGRPWGAR